jgi:hypothetical protein
LDRIKVLSVRQDKVVINSWDITYQENLKKYEKNCARFVIDDTDEATADARYANGEQMLNGGGYRRLRGRSLLDSRKKTSADYSGYTGSNHTAGQQANLGVNSPVAGHQGKRLHGIIVEERPPDRLAVADINDGLQLATTPGIVKKVRIRKNSDDTSSEEEQRE